VNSTEILTLIDRIAADPKKTVKQALIKEHAADADFTRTLVAALNPLVSYGVSVLPAKTTEGGIDITAAHWSLVESLASRSLTGHAARDAIQAALNELNAPSAQLLTRILRKNLKAGFSESTVNKAIKGLVPEFPYMRCSLPTDVKLATWPWEQGVYSQEKADGLFANVDVYEDRVALRSRAGQEFPQEHLTELVSGIQAQLAAGFEYHGELLVQVLEGGAWRTLPREQSNGKMNSIAKGGDVPAGHRVILVVWDRIPLSAVQAKGRHAEPYAERFGDLQRQLGTASPADIVSLVPTRVVHSLAEAYKHYAEFLAAGKEGSVIKRPDAIWKDGDSKEQVKLKLEVAVELLIEGFNDADIDSKNRDTFGSVACRSACGLLKVGVTGFSDEMRAAIHARREELPGTVMTVLSNSIMRPSKPGQAYSLFLPRCVELREDKHEADTLESIERQFAAAVEAVAA